METKGQIQMTGMYMETRATEGKVTTECFGGLTRYCVLHAIEVIEQAMMCLIFALCVFNIWSVYSDEIAK